MIEGDGTVGTVGANKSAGMRFARAKKLAPCSRSCAPSNGTPGTADRPRNFGEPRTQRTSERGMPGLVIRDRPVAELAAAIGLSDDYCSLIRLGNKIPHPRHWERLQQIA